MSSYRERYDHLRGLGYKPMDALRFVYGPRDFPIIRWLRWMGVCL